jgi:DNA-binding beta-propeller fold protein YncE
MIRSLALVAVFAFGSSFSWAGSSNSLLDLSTDGERMACSNRDSGTVTIFRRQGSQWEKVDEVPVGKHPEGVSFIGDSHRVAVAVYADDCVALLDADDPKTVERIPVFDEPYGVVSTKSGDRLFVTLDFPAQVIEIDPAAKKVMREIAAGPNSRGIAITKDDARLFVTEYYTAAVREIDLKSGSTLRVSTGTPEDNLARNIALHPVRNKAYVPHIRSRTQVPQGAGAIFPYITVVDTDVPASGSEGDDAAAHRKRVQMDSFRGTIIVANPWEVAVSPDGSQLCAVFSGTDDMFVCKTLDDDYRELQYTKMLRTGPNPRAVRYTPDGSQFLVVTALDFTITVVDSKTFEAVQALNCCASPLDEELLLGKRLFYSANQPMVGRRWISCSSCHPDGDSDGRTWQQPEGLRQTQPLAELAFTHPLHWSADRDEVQDFEHTIRGPLMQGRGLLRGKLAEALLDPLRGLSKELDALARYTNTHSFAMSPLGKKTDENGRRIEGEDGLTDAALRGREVFHRESVGCVKCHSGPFYCDSRTGSLTRHDVGTGNEDPSEKMGPEYDTPTLIGLYRSAPYLHHGKAETLKDVLTTYNKDDRHGKTSQLKPGEIDDLVEFLKALPYENPEAQADGAGIVKVEK